MSYGKIFGSFFFVFLTDSIRISVFLAKVVFYIRFFINKINWIELYINFKNMSVNNLGEVSTYTDT